MMPDLNPREETILRHLLRYRVTTLDFLHRLFFADLSISAVNKIVIKLVRAGWVRQFRLTPKRKYFVLSAKAYQHLLGRRQRSGLSEQTLPTAFAIASFCVARGMKRLTTEEFREHFEELFQPSLSGSAYYIDTSVKPFRLGMFLVDRDNAPRRLLSKLRRTIGQRYRIPGFQRLIQDRRFTITILTGFPEKQRELQTALQSHRSPVTVTVELAEDLALLDPRSKS